MKKNKQNGRGLGRKEKQFLHLKEFSQGKPNEISFNVLEQKAAAQDEKEKGSSWRFFRFREDAQEIPAEKEALPDKAGASKQSTRSAASKGKASKRSFGHSGSDASAVKKEKKAKKPRKSVKASHVHNDDSAEQSSFLAADSREEILKRQRRRRRARRLSLAMVILLCIGGLSVGGYWAYQQYEKLSTSVGVLREACSLIAQSDETTVAIDQYFQTAFNDDTISTAESLSGQVPDAKDKLESARLYAQKAEGELEGSQRDKEAAERALNAIAKRNQLLDLSLSRMEQDVAAKQAIDAMNEAESHIKEGNSLLFQAANVVSDTTNDNVAKSTEYTTAAKAQFMLAQQYVEAAKGLYPSASYDDSLAYLDKRVLAADEALASNEAILIQDKSTAEQHNDAYNAADQEAVALAEKLGSNFAQPIIDAYSAATADVTAQYDSLRSDAAANDAYLREYLGSSQ